MVRKKEKKENYLDYVFMKNPAYAWKEKEDGLVCLILSLIHIFGLGLFLAKSIIHAHGGIICVTDNVPSGTIFSFTLQAEEVTISE